MTAQRKTGQIILLAWLGLLAVGVGVALVFITIRSQPAAHTVQEMVDQQVSKVHYVTGSGFAYQDKWAYGGANHWRLAPDQPVRTVREAAAYAVRLRYHNDRLEVSLEDTCHLTDEYPSIDPNLDVFSERRPRVEGIVVRFAWFDELGPGKRVRWPAEHNDPKRCSLAEKDPAYLPKAQNPPLRVPSASTS